MEPQTGTSPEVMPGKESAAASTPFPASVNLFSAVLPAASAHELLQRLAETISAEALFVSRLEWPHWIGVRSSDKNFKTCQLETCRTDDLPTRCRRIGPALVVNPATPFEERAFVLLVKQAQVLDRDLLREKLASIAELAAGAGHEVNNPLGSIVGRAKLLAKTESDPDRLKTIAAIAAQAYRGRDMIGDLMLFARPPAPKPEVVAVEPALAEVCSDFARELSERNLTITGQRDASLALWADAVQFRIVLCELLRNSLRFAPAQTTIDVSTDRRGETAILEWSDSGPPPSPHERRHMFDPFFSGRQAGRGLGFGLSKCWRIATLHGGDIICTTHGNQTRFHLRWPTTAATQPSTATPASSF